MKNPFIPSEISCSSVRNYKFLTGFTIIEVIIVVLIIGIVACLSIPTFQVAMIKTKFPEMFMAINRLEKELSLIIVERGWTWNSGDYRYYADPLMEVVVEELENDTFDYSVMYVQRPYDPFCIITVYVKFMRKYIVDDLLERRIYSSGEKNGTSMMTTLGLNT